MSVFKAGIARADITPPAFTFMTGMGLGRPDSKGIHDRLFAKVLVIFNGEEKIALVTADMNYIDYDSINELRRLVEVYTDIKGENVKVSSSHCHSAPGKYVLRKSKGYGFYFSNTEKSRRVWEEEVQHVQAAVRLIAGAVYEANLKLADAEIGFGKGHSKYNIVRWHKKGKQMRYVPFTKGLKPNLKPLTEMFIMHVRNKITKESLAFYYMNSAHCICVCLQSDLITADYPAYTALSVEKKFGGLCMFAPGTIGDQHPRDFDKGHVAAKMMGEQLAGEIFKAKKKLKYSSELKITAKEAEFDMFRDKKIKNYREIYTPTRITVIVLNGRALCFWPGEAFGMITRKLLKASPFKETYLVGNTDDFKNYFVLAKEFRKYQWEKGAKPWDYDIRSGDMMLGLNLRMLKDLKHNNEYNAEDPVQTVCSS